MSNFARAMQILAGAYVAATIAMIVIALLNIKF